MSITGKVWYTAVIALVILAVTATLVCVLGTPAAAMDADRHGRYWAYAKVIKTMNSDGSSCATYQPVRKDIRTGKVRYAATYPSGRKIVVDYSICGPHWDYYGKAPNGFRIIDLSPKGRYLTFYAHPNLPVGVLQPHDIPLTVYRKDFWTGRLTKLGVVMESSFYQPTTP